MGTLLYFYRRRLRVHAIPELLAGTGVAIGVALVLATIVASQSVEGSAGEVVHAVIGPATLQLHARGTDGFDARELSRVERLPGVQRAAPILEQTASVEAPNGRTVTVELAGADTSLVVLDGLAHTLPRATLTSGGIGLSSESAHRLGLASTTPSAATAEARGSGAGFAATSPTPPGAGVAGATSPGTAGTPPTTLTLRVRGRAYRIGVSAVLGRRQFGALARATVAVLPLERLQQLAGLQRRVTRILVQPKPGHTDTVRAGLEKLAGGRLGVGRADGDVTLLRQALRPSDQASALFATLSALLGLLFALNALLLTMPDRRRAIADLALIGARGGAIVQIVAFQALCLGTVASAAGLALGYGLSVGVLHNSTGYLTEAFTFGTGIVLGVRPLLVALAGGLLTTCLATALPLLDLRRGKAIDVLYGGDEAPGGTPGSVARRGLALGAVAMVGVASMLFALAPQRALVACALLAVATVLVVPLALAGVLRAGSAVVARGRRLTALTVALSSLRATRVRSLALAATGALALFGSVALGGARGDLERGVGSFARSYAADADVWVGAPGDNQAVVGFRANDLRERVASVPGVRGVKSFQGGFMELAGRRVWVLARPPGGASRVLASQMVKGLATTAERRLGEGGWAVVSQQIASERGARVGGTIALPTPSGWRTFRVAATMTNLAWSPGAILLGAADYARLWKTTRPTALSVQLAPGTDPVRARGAIENALRDNPLGAREATKRASGSASAPGGSIASPPPPSPTGLEVTTAGERQARIDGLASEGLGQLGEISRLLLVAAVLAMAAAVVSAIWQRRGSLAALRLAGAPPRRLRTILLWESGLMMGAGCVTGAMAGIYGQLVIDRYLEHVTGFPVASLGASLRPLEILVLVMGVVLVLVTIPGWRASKVSPTVAFNA